MQDAARYPIIGSVALLGLFAAVKFLPKHIIVYVITFYFCAVGVLAIGGALLSPAIPQTTPSALRCIRVVHACKCLGVVCKSCIQRQDLCTMLLSLSDGQQRIHMPNTGVFAEANTVLGIVCDAPCSLVLSHVHRLYSVMQTGLLIFRGLAYVINMCVQSCCTVHSASASQNGSSPERWASSRFTYHTLQRAKKTLSCR